MDKINEEINILGTAIRTSKIFSKKSYSSPGSRKGASKNPNIIKKMNTNKIKTKKIIKFKKRQDFDQEREYFSANFSLSGEKILNKTKPIIEVIKSNLVKSINEPKIIPKSIPKTI